MIYASYHHLICRKCFVSHSGGLFKQGSKINKRNEQSTNLPSKQYQTFCYCRNAIVGVFSILLYLIQCRYFIFIFSAMLYFNLEGCNLLTCYQTQYSFLVMSNNEYSLGSVFKNEGDLRESYWIISVTFYELCSYGSEQ